VPRIRAASIEAHKELTRRELLDAAHDLIEEIQSADISLADVAAEVGIGRTTLYEYFRDKDDLIASMVEERLPEVIERLLVETAGGDLHQRLAALAVATVEFIVEDHVLGLILHRELPRLSPDAQHRIRLAHQDLASEMVGIYLDGVAAGVFRPMAPDIAGRLMNEVILGSAKVLIGARDPASRLDEVTAAMTEFLMAGLGAGRSEH
jgi:AcrR family transcriptional regulator